ncbi:MAG TPA: alpha-amylase/4-alpha-glucanotransferase domain-containing protein [Candidatus Acidoferrales bacterium]
MRKFELVFLIHAHQPIGNFEDVIERAYQSSYLPFVELLSRHPAIRLGLHYTGPLLEWIERAHPEYLDRLRALAASRQVEIIGGGFYEPILVTIPPQDRHDQILRLADYLEKHIGARPRGAWLAERVWEPQVPSTLAPAGVEYTLVDDNHFLGAGFQIDQLYGYYLCEDLGHTVKVLPGLKILRYLIPFHDVNETTDFLRNAASAHPGGFAAMGDDLEKFGVWPGTHDLCYKDGWLDRFFSAIEENSDWLATSTPGDAVASRFPAGRADLPTASYTEMMEWSLPTPARDRYHALIEEFSSRPDMLPFLHGGIWRGFFSKYAESNLLHKKMLHVSKKVRALPGNRRDKKSQAAHDEAATSLHQGQCNDPYWHGIFGGLYSPHLRTAVWRSLIRAEAIADRLTHRRKHYAEVARLDFDADGRQELYFTSESYTILVHPCDAATVSAIDFRAPSVALINSLARRPESYHARLRSLTTHRVGESLSIHEQSRTKEEGLERFLHYDRWPRNSFRLLLFSQDKTFQDCSSVQLAEDAALAGGIYRVVELSSERVSFASEESADWPSEKTLSFSSTPDGFEILCDVIVRRHAPGAATINVGLEVILNFLAPSKPDRYFESNGRRYPLRWAAAVPGGEPLRVVDEWQHVAVALEAPSARNFWVAPIETVSESEDGFERIYQGSQIVAVWPVELQSSAEWRGQLIFKASELT